jgi:hypothetical protein
MIYTHGFSLIRRVVPSAVITDAVREQVETTTRSRKQSRRYSHCSTAE